MCFFSFWGYARGLAACLAGLLLWTLAPRDYVPYYQAQGLSGHTSPCGECVFFSFRGYVWRLAACSAGFSTIRLLWTLAPHDYVIYCKARGLSGHTSPCGECVCFILKDSAPLEAEEDSPFLVVGL